MSVDTRGAYLGGEQLDRVVYLRPPKGGLRGVREDRILKVNVASYGLVDAARRWWLKFKGIFLPLGFVQSRH